MMHFETHEAMMNDLKERDERQSVIREQLMKNGIPWLTAIVMAGDIDSANQITLEVESGRMTVKEAVNMIGSYARFDWAVKNLETKDLLKMLPDLWRGSDPDDTNREYLNLWKEAYEVNGGKTVYDDKRKKLPKGKFNIYRGQVGDKLGISWTTDRKIAEKFAKTGGGRQEVVGGEVLTLQITADKALAYLTKRDESEVIIDVWKK